MALQNPSTLYSGGQGNFDPYKGLKTYANLLAKKKAKEDALDAYYTKSLQDVTPAGMRNKDIIGGWAQKLEAYKNFAMNPENKKYLLNPSLDGYKTVTEFNRKHTELLSESELSKQALKQEAEIFDLKKSGKLDPDDDDIVLFDRIGKSIYDPTRNDKDGKAPDLSNMSFFVPEFDATQMSKYDKSIIGKEKMGKSYDEAKAINDEKTGQVFIPYRESYTPSQIKNFADTAAIAVQTNRSAKKTFNKLLHDPDFVEKANVALQSVYGKDAIVDSVEKAAAADQIMRRTAEGKAGEEVKTDWIYKVDKNFANAKTMEGIRQANRIELASIQSSIRRADSGQKQADAFNNLELYFDNQIANGEKIPPQIGMALGINTDDYVKLPMTNADLENFETNIPALDDNGKILTDKNGKSLTIKSKPTDVLYNVKTEEYLPIGDGFNGQKFKRDGMRIAYVNHAANTVPKINILAGGGVKSGTKKTTIKSNNSESKTIRPNLQKIKGTTNKLF